MEADRIFVDVAKLLEARGLGGISPTSTSFGSIPWTEPSSSSFAAGFSGQPLGCSLECRDGSPSRLPHVREKSAPAEFRALVAVQAFGQPVHPLLNSRAVIPRGSWFTSNSVHRSHRRGSRIRCSRSSRS